jgi:hypothetical protein
LRVGQPSGPGGAGMSVCPPGCRHLQVYTHFGTRSTEPSPWGSVAGSGRVIDGQVLAGRELPPTSEAGYQHPSCTWHLRAP